MQTKPELELGEIVASVIATTIASGLMATAGLAEATAQVPDGTDDDTTPERELQPCQAVDAGEKSVPRGAASTPCRSTP
jgi:hypothetical protein